MYRSLPLAVFALFIAGFGPCDLMQQADEADAGDAGFDCSDEVCVDFLAVEIIRSDNQAFFDGVYNFEVSVSDGSRYSLECIFGGYGTGLDCSYGDLGMLGAFMESDSQTIALTLFDAPPSATFVVKYNEWKIGERTFALVYEEIYPNGPQCPPVCLQAQETMAVESW